MSRINLIKSILSDKRVLKTCAKCGNSYVSLHEVYDTFCPICELKEAREYLKNLEVAESNDSNINYDNDIDSVLMG